MSHRHITFTAIGTSWDIHIPEATPEQVHKLTTAIKKRIEEFEKVYSRFRKDSTISQIAQHAGDYIFLEEAAALFSLYQQLYEITRGKVTPLIGQVLIDAGYDAEYSLTPKETIPSAEKWNDVMNYSHPLLKTKKPIALEFGALGKGYLIDIVSLIIEHDGIKTYTVNAGGDIRYRNTQHTPLRVGLEDPDDSKKVVGIVEIKNMSICGSSGNRRAWSTFHHIIDPMSATSPTHIKALWVIADTTLLADGLATALFFTSPEELLNHFRFEYAILYSDNRGSCSPSFPGTFFSQ